MTRKLIRLINVTPDSDIDEVVDEVMGALRAYRARKVTKHAAPIHPGTGTNQGVHGRRGGSAAGKTRTVEDPEVDQPTE